MFRVVDPSAAAGPDVRTADLPSISLWAERVLEPPLGPIRWEPPSLAQVSALLPAYEILRLIGRGGMGAVYKARDLAEDRIVAIKILPPEVSMDDGYRKRFKKEAQVLEHLRHPRIVTLYDVGKMEGVCYYFVMEYVEGTNLHDAIQTRSLSPMRAKAIMCDVCEALAYAHDHGVIHRDLKPGNVLLDQAGRAKLADFGTARWRPDGTATGMSSGVVFGTKEYLPPELLVDPSTDPRTDIFALGVMLYEMFCFEMPRGQFQPPSELVGAAKGVDLIVSKAMQSNPAFRYSTVAEMRHQLETLDVSPPCSPEPGTLPSRSAPKARRKKILWGFAFGATIAVACVVAGRSRPRQTAEPPMLEPARAAVTAAPASASKQAVVAPTVLPTPERGWHDWLSENRNLPPGLSRNEAGAVQKTDRTNSTFKLVLSPPVKDQAVRVKYSITEAPISPLKLYVRANATLETYYAICRHPTSWQLLRRKDGVPRALRGDAKSPEPVIGKEEELELSARGNRLVLRHDGAVVFDERDDSFSEGTIVLEFGSEFVLTGIAWTEKEFGN